MYLELAMHLRVHLKGERYNYNSFFLVSEEHDRSMLLKFNGMQVQGLCTGLSLLLASAPLC